MVVLSQCMISVCVYVSSPIMSLWCSTPTWPASTRCCPTAPRPSLLRGPHLAFLLTQVSSLLLPLTQDVFWSSHVTFAAVPEAGMSRSPHTPCYPVSPGGMAQIPHSLGWLWVKHTIHLCLCTTCNEKKNLMLELCHFCRHVNINWINFWV